MQIVAHEIGHNLGMFHDFRGGNINSRKFENGQLCTNVGGIMDYRTNPTQWTACSVGDFVRYYYAVKSARPNDGFRPSYPFCLNAAAAPTTTTRATTTSSEATTNDQSLCVENCVSSWKKSEIADCIKSTACTYACMQPKCS